VTISYLMSIHYRFKQLLFPIQLVFCQQIEI
jgi:hypothetical protein